MILLPSFQGFDAALAALLFGDINPSGKLPFTMPKKLGDSPAHALDAYPGKDGVEEYKEGLFVGYRWFDSKAVEPLFPFGHGLSYTTFYYSKPRVEGSVVKVEPLNAGAREGAEIVQLYVEPISPRLSRPQKVLKGFVKTSLRPGEKKTVAIPLDAKSFSFYDAEKRTWLSETGDFRLHIGASSRDLRGRIDYRYTRD